MKPEQFELIFPLMIIATMVSGYYESSGTQQEKEELLVTEKHQIADDPKQIPVTPQQREWAEKAVKKYAEAQEKQWRNWNEAMFEPK
jgi:hypothetical protein